MRCFAATAARWYSGELSMCVGSAAASARRRSRICLRIRVLLDANPLEDIKNTQAIWRVIKGGWVFDPEELRPQRD